MQALNKTYRTEQHPSAADYYMRDHFLDTPAADASFQDAEPITEGQFKAMVRNFDCYPSLEGIVYEREGFPWRFIRSESYITAHHKHYPLPAKHYQIV